MGVRLGNGDRHDHFEFTLCFLNYSSDVITDDVGNVVQFIFKFNYNSEKCSVIVHDLPTEVH